jgi:hypothetical protein
VCKEIFKVYKTEYYKNLFGDPDHNTFSMMEQQVEDIPQLSAEENDILTADFTREELFMLSLVWSKVKLWTRWVPGGFL